MCPTCRDEVTSRHKCSRCGKHIGDIKQAFVNPNFDKSRFDSLSNEEEQESIYEEIEVDI